MPLARCACCSMRSLVFTFLAWICSYAELSIPDFLWRAGENTPPVRVIY